MSVRELDNGSFAGASAVAGALGSPGALDRHSAAFLYDSFTTLATLGLGDVTPRSPPDEGKGAETI